MAKDLDRLYNALGRTPFGEAGKVAAAAVLVVDRADAAINALKQKPFDAQAASALFLRLCRVGGDDVPDYESARQIGWTLRVVCEDLPLPSGKGAQISKHMAALVDELALDLPRGKRLAFDTSIAQALDAASKYRPEQFQAHLKELAKLAGG